MTMGEPFAHGHDTTFVSSAQDGRTRCASRYTRNAVELLRRVALVSHMFTRAVVSRGHTTLQGEAMASQRPLARLLKQVHSVAERLTNTSAWYPRHREEVPHRYHQALGAQWRCGPSGD